MSSKDEQIKNFWRLGRSAPDAAKALYLRLEQVEKVYRELDASHDKRDTPVRRVSVAALLLLLLATGLRAQSVAPVISEIGAKGTKPFNGSFTVNNPGITPLTAVVETPQSMVFSGGKPKIVPLLPGVTVELSQQSAKIGAMQSSEFWYTLKCAVKPCAVIIFSTLTNGQHVSSGLSVALHLPTVIYACEKQKNCRKQIIGATP